MVKIIQYSEKLSYTALPPKNYLLLSTFLNNKLPTCDSVRASSMPITPARASIHEDAVLLLLCAAGSLVKEPG